MKDIYVYLEKLRCVLNPKMLPIIGHSDFLPAFCVIMSTLEICGMLYKGRIRGLYNKRLHRFCIIITRAKTQDQ